MAEAVVKLRKLGSGSTMKVRVIVTKEFKIRVWIALRLIRLSAYILNCAVDAEVNEEEQDNG